MAETNTLARSLHDLGLAAWFGGSLMGAIGVNGAAAQVSAPHERARVANAGWARWMPVNAAAITTHLLASMRLTEANKGRLAGQQGVAAAATAKTAVTLAALAATGYSGFLGTRMMRHGDVPVEGGTEPSPATPDDVAGAQRQLAVLQWVVPALTGAALVLNALMGEQQRPMSFAAGVARRIGR